MRSIDKGNIVVAKSHVNRDLPVRPSKKPTNRLVAKTLCIACVALLTYSGSLLADDALFENYLDYGGGGYSGDGFNVGTVDFNDFSSFGDSSAPDQTNARNLDQVNVTAHAGPDEQFNFPITVKDNVGTIVPVQISKNLATVANEKKDIKNPCNHSDPVTVGNGAKVEAVTEFALPGEMGLTFARYYNSQTFGGSGTGTFATWTTSVDYHLFYTQCTTVSSGPTACGPIRFSQPDGAQLYFTQTPDPNNSINNTPLQLTGPFIETDASGNPNGGIATLTYNSNGTYTIHNEDSRVISFNPNGVVLSINDVSGIGWTITHPNSTDTVVTHTSGKSYQIHNPLPFGQNTTGTVTVTDPAGNVYQYQSRGTFASAAVFSSIGLINTATTPGSNPTTITYKYANPSSGLFGGLYTDELSEVDYNGVAHDLTSYDTVGRVIQAMDADGTEKTTFAYSSNSAGPTVTVTNALGHVEVYQYNSNGQAVSTTGNASASCPAYFSSRQYDANGNLSSVTDNNGNTTHLTYAASGRLTQKVEAFGTPVQRTTDYVWDPTPGADRLQSVTVEGLSQKTYTYNAQGRRTSVITTNLTPTGVANQTRATTFAYTLSTNGMVATKTVTPANPTNTVTYAYDSNGNVSSITNGLGQATLYGNYNALGKAQALTQPNGHGAFLSYDARGRLTGVVTSHAGAAVYSSVAYDPNSGLVSDTYLPDQEHVHNIYDADFKLTSSTWTGLSGAVITTTNTYNALGNLTGTTKALQGSATPAVSKYWDYDELGRVIATRGNNGQKTSLTYDLNSNVATSTDSAGHMTKFAYDALNRLTTTTNANGGTTTSRSGLGDRVVQVTDPRGLVTTYAYDAFGQLWTLTSPDTGTTNSVYNSYGQRTSTTPNNGIPITYAYDAIDRVTSISAGGETHTYTYDNCSNGIGQLCADATPNASSSYAYSPEGWEAQKTTNTILGAAVESYVYDYMGRLTQVTNPSGGITSVNYSWTDDQVSSVTVSLNGAAPQTVASNITYDASRNLIGLTYGNGIGRSQTYDADGRITGISSSTTSSPVQAMGFGYNNVDEMTSLADTAYPTTSQNFTYNAINRLTGMTGPAPLTLTYDPNGNRTSQTGVANGAVNVDTASNRILSRGVHTYAYDANGNRTIDSVSGSTLSYTYDGFGRMRTASRNAAASICETDGACITYPAGTMTYVVNARGQRDSKTNPNGETVWYAYLPSGQLNSELSTTRGFNYYIYLRGQPIGVVHNPLVNNVDTLYYVHTDKMGRPQVITDSAQNKAWLGLNFAFDSAPFFTAAVTGIDIGLPGQINDAETGIWSNGFRDYDSSDGRYLESDPVGLAGGVNTYAYVENNPLSYNDPLGLLCDQQKCTAARALVASLGQQLSSQGKAVTWTGIGLVTASGLGGLFAPEAAPIEVAGAETGAGFIEIGGVVSTIGSTMTAYANGGTRNAAKALGVGLLISQINQGAAGWGAASGVSESTQSAVSGLLDQSSDAILEQEAACSGQ